MAIADANGGHVSQQAAVHHLFGEHKLAGGAADIGDGKGDVVSFNGFFDLQRILIGQGQTLFHKHMLAGVGGSNDDVLMHGGRCGDNNAVDGSVSPDVLQISDEGNVDFFAPRFAPLRIFVPHAGHPAVGRGKQLGRITLFMGMPATQNSYGKHRMLLLVVILKADQSSKK